MSRFFFPLVCRGSYPAVPVKYSKELRALINSCLKNSPRQRPSINAVLRLPLVQNRIENFLSETVRMCVLCVCVVGGAWCERVGHCGWGRLMGGWGMGPSIWC